MSNEVRRKYEDFLSGKLNIIILDVTRLNWVKVWMIYWLVRFYYYGKLLVPSCHLLGSHYSDFIILKRDITLIHE